MASDDKEPVTGDNETTEDVKYDDPVANTTTDEGVKQSTEPVFKPSAATGDKLPVEKPKSRFARLFATRKRKVLAALGAVIFIIILLAAIPFTRYAVFGLVVKRDVTVHVLDMTTKKPVTNVAVNIGSHSAVTDKEGIARLKAIPVGQYTVKAMKKYYTASSINMTVPVITSPTEQTVTLKANGRPVTFTITDKISGSVVADATLKVSGTSATTDKQGESTIVVPDKGDVKGIVSASGYNDAEVTLAIGDGAKNAFGLVRSGQIVYLNNANGTIDVRRSNLDGSGSTTIVTGTGKENKYSTALLSARDWQYSVLKASRDTEKEKLYLVTTKDGTLDDVDEGDADFTLVGWLGHTFYYAVTRNTPVWSDKRMALKSYDADSRKLSTLDETSGSGSDYYNALYQTLSSVYLLNSEIVYAKYWYSGYYNSINDKSIAVLSIAADTGKKTAVKDFAAQNMNLSLSLYEPQGVYLRYSKNDTNALEYYEYEDNAIKSVDAPQGDFYDYPTYLASPSDKKTFWYEQRNGKNTIFIGNSEGKDAKQVANLSEFVPYGWYGANDEYVLFTKKGSELYIAPAGSPITDSALKVTDYYKVQSYNGYGKGYGGQ